MLVIAIIYFKSYGFEDKYYWYIIIGAVVIMILSSLKESSSDKFISEYDGRCVVVFEVMKREKNLKDRGGFYHPDGKFYVSETSREEIDIETRERCWRVYQVYWMAGNIKEPFKARVYRDGSYSGMVPGIVEELDKIKIIIPTEYKTAKRFEKGRF